MTSAARLRHHVERFVGELAPELSRLAERAGLDDSDPRRDVLIDASSIVAGMVVADGVVTDNELLAMITCFGELDDPRVAAATPMDRRREMLLRAGGDGLRTPSALFSLLRDADQRDAGRRAQRYYERAMDVAHATIALDGYTGRLELSAVEEYRSMLLRLLPTSDGAASDAPDRPDADRGAGVGPDRPGVPGGGPAGLDAGAAGGTSTSLGTVDTPQPPQRSLDDLFDELDGLVGLEPVKREIRRVADLITVERLRREADLPVAPQSRHLVFTGNPGTGKTTVARLVAQIYRTLGVVERGHLVETDRAALVAGYIGQTATRVTEVVEAATDGVLLIDEAYALVRGDDRDFGREAVDTLVKLMEDRRERLVVIVAGYPDEMDDFIASNPGLRSRFPRVIHFPDYSSQQLLEIVGMLAERHHYELTDGAREAVLAHFDAAARGPGFGNGRLARNLFEEACAQQATRVVRLDDVGRDDLVRLTAADIPD